MHDLRLPLPDDFRQLPGRGEIDLVHRRERDQVRPLGGAPEQFAFAMRDQHGPMAARPQAEDG
jgi:hypothetical protein